MINGRNTMLESIQNELKFLKSMRESSMETIEVHQKNVTMYQTKLREAHQLMDRFEKRTEMCWALVRALNEFQEGLNTLNTSWEGSGDDSNLSEQDDINGEEL